MVEAKCAVLDLYVIVGDYASTICSVPVLDDEAVDEYTVTIGFGRYIDYAS